MDKSLPSNQINVGKPTGECFRPASTYAQTDRQTTEKFTVEQKKGINFLLFASF